MKKILLPVEVWPLLVMVGSICIGSVGFAASSLACKPDVYLDKERRKALFK